MHGISNALTNISETLNFRTKSHYGNFNTTLNCPVLDKITQALPLIRIERSNLNIPKNLALADPEFIPKEIDFLIEADVFWDLLCIGQTLLGKEEPILQKISVGCLVSGPIMHKVQSQHAIVSYHELNLRLEDQLENIWKLEEITIKQPLSETEKECERQFKESITRQQDG